MPEVPEQIDDDARQREVVCAAMRQQSSLGGSLADVLCANTGETPNILPQYPPDYLERVERIGVPPEMKDSERDVKMMKYSKALGYYEKIVGHEQKSYGWMREMEIFGAKTRMNVVMACLLKELEARCKSMGMEDFKLNSLSGHVVKGGFHDYGMGVDFDAKDNWTQSPKTTKSTIPMAIVLELQKMGFKWGMYFYKSRKDGKTDPMHFDYRGTIEDAIGQLRSPKAIQLAQEYVLPKWKFKGKTLYQYAMRDKIEDTNA